MSSEAIKPKDNLKNESIKGFVWRFVQNISTQLMGFIISIVLARILLPSDYGVIALTSTFITILNVIITTGFTSALVQRKNIDEVDKSSMFYLSVAVGVALYGLVYFTSPLMASFYKEELLKDILRVQGISLMIASLFSVHTAIIQRNLQFKKSFAAGFIAVICQGIVGITLALNGFGVWALVWGTITQNSVNCILLFILCKWFPKLKFSFNSIKQMFSFSSKVLAGNLLNTIFNSSKTLIIGGVYDKDTIGYYNKGNQFPNTVMTGFDGAMTTVLFSSLSKIQDDKERLVSYLRRGMKISLTVCVPMMCGMAAVADPMIRILLTDKWESAIPFVMIECLLCMSWPLSARTQAINAIGKSGTNLLINIIMKTVSVGLLFASIPFGIYVMCLSSLISTVISFIVYSFVLRKYLNYGIKQQLADILPIYGIGIIMFLAVYGLSLLINFNIYLKLIVLVITGIVIYVGLSLLFKTEGFMYIVKSIKAFISKRKKQNVVQSNNDDENVYKENTIVETKVEEEGNYDQCN